MARYILNSSVLTAFGRWDYRVLSVDEARKWLLAGEFESTIRYQETALALESITGIHIPVRSVTCQMKAGDQALVFRLLLPPGTQRIPVASKGKLSTEFIKEHCEIGLLRLVGKPRKDYKRGRLTGAEHGRAKLTRAQIDEAHRLHYQKGITMEVLEKKYGVSKSTLWKAWQGRSWHSD